MADKMREIGHVRARYSKGSTAWDVRWTHLEATETGHPVTRGEDFNSRLLPAPEFLRATEAVATEAGAILGLSAPAKARFSSAKWGGEDKEGDRKVTVVVLLENAEALASPVSIALNLRDGALADELLELEQRAFAFADLREVAQQTLEFGEGEGGETRDGSDDEAAEGGEAPAESAASLH